MRADSGPVSGQGIRRQFKSLVGAAALVALGFVAGVLAADWIWSAGLLDGLPGAALLRPEARGNGAGRVLGRGPGGESVGLSDVMLVAWRDSGCEGELDADRDTVVWWGYSKADGSYETGALSAGCYITQLINPPGASSVAGITWRIDEAGQQDGRRVDGLDFSLGAAVR